MIGLVSKKEGKKQKMDLIKGNRVTHDKYGSGTVVRFTKRPERIWVKWDTKLPGANTHPITPFARKDLTKVEA